MKRTRLSCTTCKKTFERAVILDARCKFCDTLLVKAPSMFDKRLAKQRINFISDSVDYNFFAGTNQ